jgi:PPIC-type PPIASE domain
MIVRRRLQQKLEFLSDGLTSRIEPSDTDLQHFLDAHNRLFQSEPLFSFRQIYFNPQLHGENTAHDVAHVLGDLQSPGSRGNTTKPGDPFLLGESFENVSLSDVKTTFGEQFASAISALPAGIWRGPIQSGYGVHLVFMVKHTNSHLPALAEVRDQVRREWLNQKRKEVTDEFYKSLLKRYTVKIEPLKEQKMAQAQ